MKKKAFIILFLFFSSTLFSEEKDMRYLILPKTKTVALSDCREFFKTEIEVFSYRKQYDIFAAEVGVEEAIKGWLFYHSVCDDFTAYKKQEEGIRNEYRKKEAAFRKEENRLREIYSRKREPIEKALAAWRKQPDSRQKESEITALENHLNELEKLCADEIQSVKNKTIPESALDINRLSSEESAKNRVIEKYGLSRYSFDGIGLSFSDVMNSVKTTEITFTEVPEKSMEFRFQETGNGKPLLSEIRVGYAGNGIQTDLPQLKKGFRFQKENFFSFVAETLSDKEKFIEETGRQTQLINLSYRLGVCRFTGEELGIRKIGKKKQIYDFPVSFTVKKGTAEIRLCRRGGKTYFFLLPKEQAGSLAEHICLILSEEQIVNLIESYRKKETKKTTIKNPDFITFDRQLPFEMQYEEPGFSVSEEISKKIAENRF